MRETVQRAVVAAAQALADAAVGHGADMAWIRRTVLRQLANLGSHRRGHRMPWPLPPGADVPHAAADAPGPALAALDLDPADMAQVGACNEVLLEYDLVDGRLVHNPDPERRARGVYYTPPEAAAAMCALALGEGLRQADERFGAGPEAVAETLAFDPACGAGVFLTAASDWLAARYADRAGCTPEAALPGIIRCCCFGLDLDPAAVDLCKTALWWQIDARAPITWLDRHITIGNTLDDDQPPALAERRGHHPEHPEPLEAPHV